MDSVNNQANKPSMLSSAGEGFKATVGSFFSGLSPTTWFGSKTTSMAGSLMSEGFAYGGIADPCGTFVYVEPVKTPEYGKSYHFDAEDMSQETAASAMRYAAAIQVTTESVIRGINPLNLANTRGVEDNVDEKDDFEYVTFTKIPGQDPIYTGNNANINIDTIEGKLTLIEDKGVNYYVDHESGLAFTALTDSRTGEIVVSFPGLGGGAQIPGIKGDEGRLAAFTNAQLSAVTKQLVGDVPQCYKQAAAIVAQLKDNNPNAKVTTTGFSFGGSVAQYAALKHESDHPNSGNPVTAHCFNGLAIGAGLQKDVGDTTLNKADERITHYGTGGDWVTDLTGIKTLDKILGFIGFRTPGNYGKKYVLPPAKKNEPLSNRHAGIMNNMLNKSGWKPEN